MRKALRTYLPHTKEAGGFRIIQFFGGKTWSVALYLKPKHKHVWETVFESLAGWTVIRCEECGERTIR